MRLLGWTRMAGRGPFAARTPGRREGGPRLGPVGGPGERPGAWWRRPGTALAAAAALCVFVFGAGIGGALAQPAGSAPVRLIRSVPVPVKAVALTFDDGPSPEYTPQVLALLKEYGARATFFVVGLEIARFPGIAKEEAAAGMELGNHGFRHLSLVGLDPSTIETEVLPVEQEITAITGERPVLYRLPKGRSDSAALRALTDMGYTIVYWSIDTRDYTGRRAAATIAAQVEKQVRPGSIVILHDGGGNRQQTVDALRMFLPVLKKEGYQMVTVSQLLEMAQTGAS